MYSWMCLGRLTGSDTATRKSVICWYMGEEVSMKMWPVGVIQRGFDSWSSFSFMLLKSPCVNRLETSGFVFICFFKG